jgi:UDP-GlcNAc:undecaprenyl-phosphate GlcNAc-1-phosphate transferase
LTPLARRVAVLIGSIDAPVGLKIHKHATPLMGGVAVFLAFASAAAFALPLSHPVIGLLCGGAIATAVGVADEKYSLSPLVHLAGHIVAASVAIVAGLGTITTISLPFSSLIAPGYRLPEVVGLFLTILWLVGMMNTINFLDGLDGLVTGVGAEVAIVLAIWASEPDRFYLPASIHHEDLLLPLALLGALLGFLPYNWHTAKIFLGDSGAMFIGLALGSFSSSPCSMLRGQLCDDNCVVEAFLQVTNSTCTTACSSTASRTRRRCSVSTPSSQSLASSISSS